MKVDRPQTLLFYENQSPNEGYLLSPARRTCKCASSPGLSSSHHGGYQASSLLRIPLRVGGGQTLKNSDGPVLRPSAGWANQTLHLKNILIPSSSKINTSPFRPRTAIAPFFLIFIGIFLFLYLSCIRRDLALALLYSA